MRKQDRAPMNKTSSRALTLAMSVAMSACARQRDEAVSTEDEFPMSANDPYGVELDGTNTI